MRVHLFLLSLLTIGGSAMAAEAPGPADRSGTAVYLQAGMASSGHDMGRGALGGSIVFDVTSRLSLEANGAWLGGGMGGGNSVSGSGALLLNIRPVHEKVVPYFAFGGGVYHTSFDMDGGMGGTMMGRGMMGGDTLNSMMGTSGMSAYDGRRMGFPDAAGYHSASYTDPALSLGGGLRIDIGSKVFIRPDARALVVFSGGDSLTVGLFTASVGYRF